MALESPEIVSELVESVLAFGQVERGQDSPVNLTGRPAGQQAAVVKQDFEQTNQSGIVQFQPWVMHRADPDRQRDPL